MNESELLKAAGQEITYSNVYYGKCIVDVWEGKFPRNEEGRVCGRPVRWYEGDPQNQRMIMVDMLLDLCPGSTSNFPIKISCPTHDKDWQKVILPSLREIGAVDSSGNVDIAQVKDHWVKMQQVEGTRPREKGNPDKGNWNTYKFLAVYKSEKECLDAMAIESGDVAVPGDTPAKSIDKNDQRRAAALEFCRVAIGTYKGLSEAEIRDAIGKFIESNPNAKPYITVNDPEIVEMITEAAIPFS